MVHSRGLAVSGLWPSPLARQVFGDVQGDIEDFNDLKEARARARSGKVGQPMSLRLTEPASDDRICT